MKRFFVLFLMTASIYSAFGDDTERELFLQAENRFLEKKYEIAIDAYDAFLRTFPASELAADAQFRRASALYLLERYRESADLFRRIELRYRSTRYLRLVPFWKGLASYRLKDYEGAAREFSGFLQEDSGPEETEQALLYKTLAEKELGRYKDAASSFRALLDKTDPRRAAEYSGVVLSSLTGKNPEEERALSDPAEESLKAALGGVPEEIELRFRLILGEAAARRGRYAESESFLKPLVLEKNRTLGNYPRAAYLLGYVLYRSEKYDEAAAAVDAALESGAAKEYYPPLLRLKALAASRRGEPGRAVEASTEYLGAAPADSGARFEVLRYLADMRDYRGLRDAAAGMMKDSPDLSARDPGRFDLVRYLRGTAELNLGNYPAASELLSEVSREGSRLSAEVIVSARYYAGWAFYRQVRYEEALAAFSAVLRETPREGGFYPRASYYAAWCAYSLGRFQQAADILTAAGAAGGEEAVVVRRIFLLGQSLAALGRYKEAGEEYRRLFSGYPSSETAGDAHFEYAGIFEKTGDAERAAAEYRRIPGLYPASPLGESALLRRGEIFFAAGRWTDARNAFYDYRAAYPVGKSVDQALYWGGISALKAGERHGALLLLENLADRYPDSSFRPSALREIAEILARLGEYSQAAGRYRQLVTDHPAEAASFEAGKRLEELRLLEGGAAEREASLLTRIRTSNGSSSADGREALLELSRFYIGEGRPRSEKARPLLRDLRGKAGSDPKRAAEAGYLLGELARGEQKYAEAASLYLAAASEPGAEPDLVARSLLRSAEMMKLSDRPDEARRLVDLLRKNFPGTDWVGEGEKILGGGR